MAERSKRTGINADRVLQELGKIAFVNAADVIDMNNATVKDGADRDDTAAIASVKVKVISGANGEGIEREIRLADKLKAAHEGNVWICGGAAVAGQLLKEGRIDKLWLSIIPTVLGKGVRLFPELSQELPMKLVGTEHWNGIVDLVYEKR